ncbi:hypothetical protein V2H45_21775 [Tumidithrix elongata RA019]|uniref:Uncharacterized protein n=1 Tax=Tumidithrix elongata BACA0141 TaxID=2716417 RepID=A0AAW9PWJ6_9CYAN|nr:hypothetical protein [Tumidithrix elongata RA019]
MEFRGWREIDSSTSVCAHCKSYAVEVSELTVERAIETTKKGEKSDRKPKEKIPSVRLVKQTVYSCHFCGCVFAYDRQETPMLSISGSGDYSSSDFSSSYSSSSSDSSSYDSSYSSDYGSSSSDFGGGSSDGGGAGGDW